MIRRKKRRGYMKKRVLATMMSIVLLLTAMLSGCSVDSTEKDDNQIGTNATENYQGTGNDNVSYTGIKMSEDFKISEVDRALYDNLFNINSEVRISIDIPKEEMIKIQKDYDKYSAFGSKSPIYRMCTMIIEVDGEKYTIPEVGIRMKGNTSRRSFYDITSDTVYNLIHFKISFTETFDDVEYYGKDAKVWTDEKARKERKDRTFASLEGLELKWNRDLDATYTRDTYAYKMYRDFGVLAPNNTLGTLEVNGKNWGVYKIHEPVDKIFLKRYFDEEDLGGDLYKCAWAGKNNANYTKVNGLAGIEDEDTGKFYPYDLKTNKTTSTHESLKNLVSTVKNTGNGKEEIEKVLDVDNWLKFLAVSYFLGMPDDLRNNYNNHYVYFKASTGQAVFIAYDCEICLGIDSWNPTGSYLTESNPYSGWAYGANQSQANPLVKRIVSQGGLYTEEFKVVLDKVVNSKWINANTFEVMYGALAAKYEDDTDIDIDIPEFDERLFTMSIDETYKGQKINNNLTIVKFFSLMRDNYYAHRDLQ